MGDFDLATTGGFSSGHTGQKDKRYYYCEMTAKGWEIGQLPDEYSSVKIDVAPIPGVIVKMISLKVPEIGIVNFQSVKIVIKYKM